MKTLSITLAVNATNTTDAEKIAKRELMYMAKTIAKRCGAAMGSGNGNTTRVFDCIYKIDAEVQIDCNENINDVAKEIQSTWTEKEEIVSSMIFVNEPEIVQKNEPKYTCDTCCKKVAEITTVYGKHNKYDICNECLYRDIDNGVVFYCDSCKSYVTNFYENPVTHKRNICPKCGAIV